MNGRTAPWAYFDIFSDKPAQEARDAQIAGLNAGYNAASGNINQGINALNMNYTAALQPFLGLADTANTGVTQLKNVLGLGPGGMDAALTALRSTPGYKFQQQTLDDTVNAAASANGTLASGNQLLALNKVNQGLADSTYGSYVNSLMPFLSTAGNAAAGIGNIYTGLGSQLSGQYDSLANLGWQKETGIGNANANADLAKYNASANLWKGIGALGGSIFSAFGGGGGGMGSSIMGAVPGAVGPSSVGGAPLSTSLFSSIFSDERLKEDIEQVGELYDGQPVYKYRYVDSPAFQIGLMAQDVEEIVPDAVTEIAGFKAVDYNKATGYAAELSRFLEAA